MVDALEFVFTGKVSRLSGEGRGDISLKEHGPHVDKRSDPDKARVQARITFPSLKKTVVIERSVKTPTMLNIVPKDDTVLRILQQIETRPEIVLSRRELIRYVLATPGKRAEEIQALLHLDQVEQVRVGLQKIANNCERQVTPLANVVTDARINLLRALGLTELKAEKVLVAANSQRALLGLPSLTEMISTTSLKDGMATPKAGQPVRMSKTQVLADIKAAQEALDEICGAAATQLVSEILVDLGMLATDPTIAMGVKQERFYSLGMELSEPGSCPFCDAKWDLDQLKKHVQSKISHLKEVSAKRAGAEKKLSPITLLLQKVQGALDMLASYGARMVPTMASQGLSDYSAACRTSGDKLLAFLPLDESINVLNTMTVVPQVVRDEIDQLQQAVSALPEATRQDAARDWLTLGQERLEVFREANRKLQAAKEHAAVARQLSDAYVKISDEVLTGLYADVEKDFAALYGFINRDDENDFKAKLVPSMGKLGFDVDFYGRGFFPPGAYHSEGHQDGMGLCLYLALMRHLYGATFTFAVLDDVLMSVDAGHRREVCALMKREFPNTQFVVTTHDPIWLRHMKTERLITSRSGVQFRCWNIDHGPTCWDDRDVWKEIEDYLNRNDIRSAAALLRHFLEYTAGELCHRLRAPVEYRGDARYQLGELLPAAASLRRLYGSANEAASSWNQKEVVGEIVTQASKFSELVNKSNVEQWQVNVAVHFNSWDNLEKDDFAPVVKACRELLSGFTCPNCGDYLRVSPERERVESLRCDCDKTHLNLCKKGA
ncbi:MAG: chromosome segregation protein SMC [Verrucomicrobia bacterium]|nr:chromosome segregation protein SMC [Verrucomicrobiota bacterium]